MIELQKDGEEVYINEALIAVVEPRKGQGAKVYAQDYFIREGHYICKDETTETSPEDIAEEAGLVKATKQGGEWVYFNPEAILTAQSWESGNIKLRFPVDLADGSKPVSSQSITIKESLEELEVI